MPTSAPAVVSFEGVTCRYGDLVAVDDVTLRLPPGVVIGVVGPSGSGKTTIVRTMRGAVSPALGTVMVFGHDPRYLSQRDRRRLGYMPQTFSLYPDLTALSDSERQVVQLSLFLLLASVFFGGFILSVDEFHPAAQVISYLLPVTHGIQLLQDAMLRGEAQPGWEIDALGVMILGFSLLAWRLVRRTIAQA